MCGLSAHSFASLDAPVNVIFELSAQDIGSFVAVDEHGGSFVTVRESDHRAQATVLVHHQLKEVGFEEGAGLVLVDLEYLVAHGDSMV